MQLEELGQRGEVEGAQVLLREVEALERERERERAGLMRDSSKVRALHLLGLALTCQCLTRLWQDLKWMQMTFMKRWNYVMCVGLF